MNNKNDRSEWLKKDLEDASKETENLPVHIKQALSAYERPLELSQEAQKQRQAYSAKQKQVVYS